MYPSRRQSPGSGVGLDRGAGGGLTGIDLSMPTKLTGRGAAVPAGVLRTRGGVADGSAVGVAAAAGASSALGDNVTARTPPTKSRTATAAAPMRTRGASARRCASAAFIY